MKHSPIDHFITEFDTVLRTLGGATSANRPNPALGLPADSLTDEQKQAAAALMRVNHCGEVCAQALYLGQSITSRSLDIRTAMQSAALEEADHLAWCEDRIQELGSHTSVLNPVFFTLSFGSGLLAGLLGKKFNLGFVAATEDQVVQHLNRHIEKLPTPDLRSKAVLEQMRDDEEKHMTMAIQKGGANLPNFVKKIMAATSKVMTRTTYWV